MTQIFNPHDLRSLELDSVFQLKKFTRDFYERKVRTSKDLLQALDALSNERPRVLQAKRKHFGQQSFSNTKH